jgi:hypothetical protein
MKHRILPVSRNILLGSADPQNKESLSFGKKASTTGFR